MEFQCGVECWSPSFKNCVVPKFLGNFWDDMPPLQGSTLFFAIPRPPFALLISTWAVTSQPSGPQHQSHYPACSFDLSCHMFSVLQSWSNMPPLQGSILFSCIPRPRGAHCDLGCNTTALRASIPQGGYVLILSSSGTLCYSPGWNERSEWRPGYLWKKD